MNPTKDGAKRVLQDRARAAKALAALADRGPNRDPDAASRHSATADRLVQRIMQDFR